MSSYVTLSKRNFVHTYNDFRQQSFAPQSQVVAIGNFDGVHLGHRSLFALAHKRASELGLKSAVLTFHPHPLKLLFPSRRIFLITSYQRKAELIESSDIDNLVIAPFDHEFADLKAEDFVSQVLVQHLGVAVVVVGENYTFGRNREGTLTKLHELGTKYGFTVAVAPPFLLDGELVSSTKIREAIMQGDIERAARFLGRECAITGKVVHGKGRGRGIGFPTANLVSEVELYPKEGVYAVWVESQGQRLMGVMNIGYNPTFADTGLTVEVHILDFDKDLYGQELKVVFVKRLRSEMSCSGIDELRSLIAGDVAKARKILSFTLAS